MNKKASGLVQGLILGVAGLVIAVILAFVLITNVAVVGDSITSAISGANVINETVTGASATDGDVLAKFGTMHGVQCTAVTVYNSTNAVVIPAANYSLGKTTCNLNFTAISTGYIGYDAKIIYGWTYDATSTASDNIVGNFTSGIDNVSGKIPTILLIAAIVLILGILVLLWTQYKKMDTFGGGL